MTNGLGRWSESLDRAVFMLTLSSPLIINHQSVLNVHLQSPVSRVSERQANDRAWLLVRFMTRPLRAEDRPRRFLGLVNKVRCFRRVEHRRRYRQTERHHDHAQ